MYLSVSGDNGNTPGTAKNIAVHPPGNHGRATPPAHCPLHRSVMHSQKVRKAT